MVQDPRVLEELIEIKDRAIQTRDAMLRKLSDSVTQELKPFVGSEAMLSPRSVGQSGSQQVFIAKDVTDPLLAHRECGIRIGSGIIRCVHVRHDTPCGRLIGRFANEPKSSR